MAEPSRQLAAIRFTDIVGYTALMGEDEEAFEYYRMVAETFPDGQWADDARAEMVTLAKRLYRDGKKEYRIYLKETRDDADEDVKLAALSALGQLNSEEAFLPVGQ